MLLAGLIVFITTQINEQYMLELKNLNLRTIFLCIMGLYIVMSRIVLYVKDKRSLSKYIYKVNIKVKDDEVQVVALLDTGNELREPVTNLPVLIIERSIFPNNKIDHYERIYIPYQSVNNSKNLMEGFIPEGVKIFLDDEEFVYKKAVVAFCNNNLNNENEYNALLSRGIL
jgi:stage II sporulation protein GA (sporulation sigma-E factor processing peptidase)